MGDVARDDDDMKIIKQLEHYFGNINLPRDKFLQELIKEDDGWIPLTTMLKFNRLSAISQDTDKIANAVKGSGSTIVTVSEDNSKIRRNAENPLPENREKIKHRTVHMEGFPLETQLDEIISWANSFGSLECVGMHRTEDRIFKGIASIIFKTREEAEAAQKSQEKFKEFELTKIMQEEYWKLKRKEKKLARAAAWAEIVVKNKTIRYKKGLILLIDGISDTTFSVNIRIFFNLYGSVAYVGHEYGSNTAYIRFDNDSEGGAQGAWDKAVAAGTDGKVILENAELTGKVLDEEEEKQYWDDCEWNANMYKKKVRIANRRNRRRGNRPGGRRGRRHGKRRLYEGEPKHTVFRDSDSETDSAETEDD